MTKEALTPDDQRGLLGLRPPAELASGPVIEPAVEAAARAPPARPARPDYPVVSSGWDSEDGDKSSKRTDLMTALRAGIMLLLLMVGLGLLIAR